MEIRLPGSLSRSWSTSEPEAPLGLADRDELRVEGLLAGADALGLHQLDDALDAERPADGRRITTAEMGHEEPVVAPGNRWHSARRACP